MTVQKCNCNRCIKDRINVKLRRETKRLAIFMRDGFRCLYCYKDLTLEFRYELSIDHLIPTDNRRKWSLKENQPKNTITSCQQCNNKRKRMPWEEFATPEARARIEEKRNQPISLKTARYILEGKLPAAVLLKFFQGWHPDKNILAGNGCSCRRSGHIMIVRYRGLK